MNKTIERFWSKVEIRGTDECWNWKAGIRHKYGAFRIGIKMIDAHRVAYNLTFGNIPPTMSVLHKCDNCKCVNPNHLFLGTQKDNMIDMDIKGRRVRGEISNLVKLKELEVFEIRRLYKTRKITQTLLGKMFLVNHNTIYNIVRNKTWKHLESI